MKRILFAALALTALASPIDKSFAEGSATSIVGVWKLTSFVRKEVSTNKLTTPFGEHPTGYRIHTKDGHAAYIFTGDNRKAPAGTITDQDRVDLFKTMAVAAGTYKIDGEKVFFHPEVSASQTFQDLVYRFEISGSKLVMTTDPIKTPTGDEIVFLTTYERAE